VLTASQKIDRSAHAERRAVGRLDDICKTHFWKTGLVSKSAKPVITVGLRFGA
jgi:hypothetical protein